MRCKRTPKPKMALTPTAAGTRATMVLASQEARPVPKHVPIRSEAYRRLVASLPCAICGVVGYTQACHADYGKGMLTKTDDTTCWPGCGPHGDYAGCHFAVGMTGALSRAERRELELALATETHALLRVLAKSEAHIAAALQEVGLL